MDAHVTCPDHPDSGSLTGPADAAVGTTLPETAAPLNVAQPSAALSGTHPEPGALPPAASAPSLPPPAASPGALAAGATLGAGGRYRIERLIGRGGFAETYLARDGQLFDAPCVVKHLVLPAGDAYHQSRLATIEREARLLVQLKTPGHPNIPEVYEYLAEARCLVMKYVAGRSLRDVLRAEPRGLAEEVVLRYARSICSALAYMHARGVIHLDLKPDNLLYDQETDQLWVIDFGIGRAGELPADGPGFGTRGYTPPEQWRGQPTPASDIYALAATMWALLTRQPPGLDGSIGQPAAPIGALRPEVRRLIALGLAEEPADRPTAAELLGELEALISPDHIPPPPAPRPPPLPREPVGRMNELAALEQQLHQGHLAIISGIAGVGKTTLGAMLARRQAARCRVFWHTFHPGEDGAVVIWHLAAFLAAHGYGDLWRIHHRAPYHNSPAQLVEARCDYAAQALLGRSLLVCLDDLHVVEDDPVVRRLIAALSQGWRGGAGGLVLISRHLPPGLAGTPPAALGGLSPADAAVLVAARGLALSEELLGQIHGRTGGNAQLLILAIDALRQSAAPARLIERLSSSANIEGFLLTEVDERLGEAERAVLEAASALLGYGGGRDALAAALGRPLPRRVVHDLVRRNLLTAGEVDGAQEYGLHAIMQAYYYDELEPAARRAMHQRLADHYEAADPRPLEATRHAVRAGDFARAVAVATASLWELINAGQARPLVAALAEARPAALAGDQRAMLHLACGDILTVLREGAEAQAAYRAVLDDLAGAEMTPAARRALTHACRGMAALREYDAPDEALGWIERGLAALPAEADGGGGAFALERAQLLHRQGAVLLSRGDGAALEPLGAALAILPAGEERLRADILINLGVAHCEQGDPAAGAAQFAEAQALCERLGHGLGLAVALQNLGMIADYGGDWATAEATYRAGLTIAERIGDVNRQSALRLNLGTLALQRDHLEQARAELETVLRLAGRHGLGEYLVAAGASLAELHLRAGELGAAGAALESAERAAAERGADDQRAELARLRAALALARGDAAEALALAAEALALAEGDPREAGLALRVRGEAALAGGDPARGLADLAASAELLGDVDPHEAARTRLIWGAALIADGDAERGAALRHAAREALAELGAGSYSTAEIHGRFQ